MIPITITVRVGAARQTYTGVFENAACAILDALERFGVCHISARPARKTIFPKEQ